MITDPTLTLIRQHAQDIRWHTDTTTAASVCETLGIEIDEGCAVSWPDAAKLAATLYKLAATLAARVDAADNVAPVTLADALQTGVVPALTMTEALSHG